MPRTSSRSSPGPIGEEGSDPLVLAEGEPYRQDQFAQSGHYAHVDDDLRSIAGLGVKIVRYGVPWRLSEPEPGHYDWTLWDRALAGCAEHGLEPIVDLLHFRTSRLLRRLRRPAMGGLVLSIRRGVPRALPRAAMVHTDQRAGRHGYDVGMPGNVERPARIGARSRADLGQYRVGQPGGTGAHP